MKRLAVFVAIGLLMGGCSPDGDATGSSCAKDLYRAYNPKSLEQCVAVCKRCDHGTTATCNTSCTLKGAR